MIRTLVIRTDGSWSIQYVDVTLDWLQAQVGGYIESFSPHNTNGKPRWIGYCNEDGKIIGLPPNEPATWFAHQIGWPVGDIVHGDIVFLGNDGSEDETDVPQWVVDLVPNSYTT